MISIVDFAEFLEVVLTGIFGDPLVGGNHLGLKGRGWTGIDGPPTGLTQLAK